MPQEENIVINLGSELKITTILSGVQTLSKMNMK